MQQATRDTAQHEIPRFYPPHPAEEPLPIGSVLLSAEHKDLLLRTGICAAEDVWDPQSKVSHCYRCDYKSRATNALSAPLACKKCGQADWNLYALFCCRACHYLFASATGSEPYVQYPQCPHCKEQDWLPRLQPSRPWSWRDWAFSVLGSFAMSVGITAVLLLLGRSVSADKGSYFLMFAFSCLLPLAGMLVPMLLLYRALTGTYAQNWGRFLLLGGLFLALPVAWVIFGK